MRAALLAEVYGAPRRSRDYLEGAPDVRWPVRFAGRDLVRRYFRALDELEGGAKAEGSAP